MGLFNRISTLFKAKMSKIVDAAEDPNDMLDYSYLTMVEKLKEVRQGVVGVTAAKKRLEIQRGKLIENATLLETHARDALAKNRDALAKNNEGVAKTCEDLARLALERKASIDDEVKSLDTEITTIAAEQQKLVVAERVLETKVNAFRTQKEVIKAKYSTAKAKAQVSESIAGVGEDMADVGISIERAQNRTEEMNARSDAIDELIDAGTLKDFTGTEDDIARELSKIGATSGVDEALAKMKAEAAA